ncbi:MAG TPA: AraC family ligand binding domain-containing protein [Longimicrobiaceae bacterium]|nr:AraC family ligand binding domain-containing protein [Longimicrobiaceae bacterium]
MKTLATEPVAPRGDRPTTTLLHDEPNARVVAFQLLAGQRVAEHRSASTVLVQVVEGEGVFRGEDGERRLAAGGVAVFAPGEAHAVDAPDGPLRFLAVITPGPS